MSNSQIAGLGSSLSPLLGLIPGAGAILAPAAQLGFGIWGATEAGKIPKELEDLYNQLKSRSQYGIDESQYMLPGAAQIGQQTTGMQARGAMALASRGTGSSSAADEMIAGVSRAQGEMFGNLQSAVMRLDEAAKQDALQQLMTLAPEIVGQKKEQAALWGDVLGGGVGSIMDLLDDEEIPEWQQQIDYLMKMGLLGEGETETESVKGYQSLDEMFPNLGSFLRSV